MKIQWMLIAALLLVTLIAEADGGSTVAGAASDAHDVATSTALITDIRKYGPLSTVGQAEAQSCAAAADSAKNFCIVSLNSGMQKAVGTVGILLSAASALTSITTSCSKFGDALKVAQVALAAYNTACGMAQQSCEKACSTASSTITAKLPELAPLMPQSIYLTAQDLQLKVSAMSAKCVGYKANLTAAAVGMGTLVASSAMAGKCETATASVDCTKDPMNAACAKALDCSLASNTTNTTCICQKAPNTAGCAGYTASNGNTVNATDSTTEGDLTAPALNIASPNGAADVAAISPVSSGGGGAASGGGGGGGGALSGGSSVDGSKNKEKAKGLNPNILSGYDGGGGGGYRGSSGSSKSSDLQAYMPAGSKDPARNPATQLFGGGEVTRAGSKSNFEKVNESYGEVKPSLLPGQ